MGTQIDLVGQRFERLLVLDRAQNKGNLIQWRCKCDCGNESIASTKKLRNGRRKSCGCARLPSVMEAKVTHGHSCGGKITAELRIWMNMRSRCNCQSNKSFNRYGGRGITICKSWDDFGKFLLDMGERPSAKHSLDRIDNDGPYCADNCRWATSAEQSRNRSSNVMVEYQGKSLCAKDAAEMAGIKHTTLLWRINAGWPTGRLFDELHI